MTGYRVVCTDTGDVVAGGFQTVADAHRWIRQNPALRDVTVEEDPTTEGAPRP